MIVQFRNEKVSNHGSIPITIDCNVVAFIVFEEGFHQPIKRTKQTFRVRVNNSYSNTGSCLSVVPQVLSPYLYNIYTHDFPQHSTVSTCLFADDSVVLSQDVQLKYTIKAIQNFLDKLETWLTHWRIAINVDKSQAIVFRKWWVIDTPFQITLFDDNIQWVSVVKYLGLHIDSRLTFKKHIDYLAEKFWGRILLAISLIGRRSPLSLENKVILYKQILRSVITYGSPIWGAAAATHRKKIQVIQNKILRVMANAPWKTTRREDRKIVRQALVTVTRSTIRADVGVAIVPQTISRHLAEANLKSKRPFRALPLTPQHRQLRLQWCQARSMWNVTGWQKVVFSDESRFVLGTDEYRVRVWRRPGERYNSSHTARTAGVMVSGAIAYDSWSTLIVMRGTLTGQRYVDDILRPHVGPFLNGLPGAIFQQDNAHPYTARVAPDFLHHFKTIPWPARSPNLSPVEHVWDQLKQQMLSCHSVHDLELAVQDLWAHLPQDNIRCLINSMPDRVAAFIAAGGGPTRY
ncbi:RNA-directed DNA polymerase from mobile element jockey [Trichonephila clavipes]|nr:RNA-directed DNA polymerase from mobile element jockey [Trichonephila clavipes]